MIIIYHYNNKVVEIGFEDENVSFSSKSIAFNLFQIAEKFPDELIIWCRLDLKLNLNVAKIQEIFHHKKIAASYNLSAIPFLSKTIGYVDESPFLNVKNNVSYPTWQMSGDIGGIHAEVLNALNKHVNKDLNFEYFLLSLAKLASAGGLLCYSEPLLIKNFPKKIFSNKKSNFITFRFVKQHYRTRWVFILFLNLLIYEGKLSLMPFLLSFVFRKRKLDRDLLNTIKVQSLRKVIDKKTIDVIIPTIGRKKYLYDVLKDLSKQTHLPENVIIIEQNPDLTSVSELDYLDNESWPFTIKHTFTHQAGACNARNLALSEVTSEWVFLNDDDNRFKADLIERTLRNCEVFGTKVASNSYLKVNEIKRVDQVCQASIFGSGNSFIATALLEKVSFRMGFEFGYGEDSDFGMQLRNIGADVLYFPNPEITHLSAPIGGFRTKPVLAWAHDSILPKPSPTVMLYKQLHLTKEQIDGYKTLLFFKFYKVQSIKNPFRYLKKFQKQWKQSLYWANKLNCQ